MTRRELITLLGGAATAWPFATRAQATKVARVGFLRQAGPHAKQLDAFRDGLRAAGYIEGQNNPVVFTLAVDPVADGLAASFARPGGNLTGVTMTVGYGLAGKRLELLKDIVTGLSRVAVLSNPANPTYIPFLHDTERAATALGLEVRAFGVQGPNDLLGVFAAMAEWRAP
jgi:ABC-type uncharacterized transport system substrate-binding protein